MSMDYELEQSPKSSKSYVLTLLLAYFLGTFGVHRFYTGYVLIGVIQLLTLGGLCIWTFIDLVSFHIVKPYSVVSCDFVANLVSGCSTTSF